MSISVCVCAHVYMHVCVFVNFTLQALSLPKCKFVFFIHPDIHSSAIMSIHFNLTQFIILSLWVHLNYMSFPDSSVDKKSARNVGDIGLIHGSGRSAGDGINYPLPYSWPSL